MPVSLQILGDAAGIVRAALSGEVRHADARAGEPNPFRAALGEHWASRKVLIDFGRVTQIDSATVGWLMSSAAHFRRGGGAMAIHSAVPAVAHSLQIMNVQKIIPLATGEAEATALLSRPPATLTRPGT